MHPVHSYLQNVYPLASATLNIPLTFCDLGITVEMGSDQSSVAAGEYYKAGDMVGNTWTQWADSEGRIFYQRLTGANGSDTQWEIPAGWEDAATDIWKLIPATAQGHWKRWQNQRTGRLTFFDPNPPPTEKELAHEKMWEEIRVFVLAQEQTYHTGQASKDWLVAKIQGMDIPK